MKLGNNDVGQIVITREDEVVAVISDNEIVEKEGYKVIVEPIK